MAPPGTLPTWGTAIDPGDISTPSGAELASGIIKVGSPAIPQKLPYQWFNWLLYWLCQWNTYFFGVISSYLTLSPVALSSNQAAWNPNDGFNSFSGVIPGTKNIQVLATGQWVISGMVAGFFGQRVQVTNAGFYPFTFKALPPNALSGGFYTQSGYDVIVYPQQSVELYYNQTNGWTILTGQVTPLPHKKERRYWALNSDPGAATPTLAPEGISASSFVLSGTGGSITAAQPVATTSPVVTLDCSNTSGHEAKFTPTNPMFPFYNLMNLFIHCSSLLAGHAAQAFIGYSDGTPDLTGIDPLPTQSGFGIWMKWTTATTYSMWLVNNDGSASSIKTPINAAVVGQGEIYADISLSDTNITCSVTIGGVVQTSALVIGTQVPAPTATTTLVAKPWIYVRTNDNFVADLAVSCVMGDFPA